MLNYKEHDNSFSSAALQKEWSFVQSPEMVTQLHCVTTCIHAWETRAPTLQRTVQHLLCTLEAGDAKVLMTDTRIGRTLRIGMRKQKVNFPHSLKILWPLLFPTLPSLRDKSTGLGAVSGKDSFPNQTPGTRNHNNHHRHLKILLYKTKENLFFFFYDNKPFQPSKNSLMSNMNILPLQWMSTWVHLLQCSRCHLLYLLLFFSSLPLFKEESWLTIRHTVSVSMADCTVYTVCCTWAAGCNSTSKQPLRAPCPEAITQQHIYHLAEMIKPLPTRGRVWPQMTTNSKGRALPRVTIMAEIPPVDL